MKKVLALILALTLSTSLVACGGNDVKDDSEADVSLNQSEIEAPNSEDDNDEVKDTENDDTSEKESVADSDEEKNDDSETENVEDVNETDETAPEASGSSTALSDGKFVNLDNMEFAINGKVYKISETTLQTLIDDGVPFDEDDIMNANNNINGNSESQGFRIDLAEYWSAQVYVLNSTDENKTIAECPISKVYLPVNHDKTQNILELSIPLDITEETLIAQAGEPTDRSEYFGDDDYVSIGLEYKRDSDVYIGDWGYDIEFINNELRYVTIDYMP